jgi:hypothetical protein
MVGCALGNGIYTMDLSGQWFCELDPNDQGIEDQWNMSTLTQPIWLPGTLDQAGIGYALRTDTMDYAVAIDDSDWPGHPTPERIDEAGHLVRERLYIGKAWYQRDIEIPQAWAGKYIQLRLERVMWASDVWIDQTHVGYMDSLATEHRFDLKVLMPGTHRLTIRVDNSMIYNIGLLGHAYGPETQSRWNGLVGDLELIACDPVFVNQLRIFPAEDRHSVDVQATLRNTTSYAWEGQLELSVLTDDRTGSLGGAQRNVKVAPGEQVIHGTVTFSQPAEAWDEFNPIRYRLKAQLQGQGWQQAQSSVFGFRHLQCDGRYICLNGRRIYLRGTLDCCVYPKTGHPPLTVTEWKRVLGVIKEHGFNHVRTHTWCPPEAAFEAADQLGLYLEVETVYWVDGWSLTHGTQPLSPGHAPEPDHFIQKEIRRISDAYGNHPSFAFFCIGNEFSNRTTNWPAINQWLADAKAHDPRRLYNATTARQRVAADDFWVTHSTGSHGTRGMGPAHTNWDFSKAARSVDLPLVAHETGQRPVFPDYESLLPKFTGPLKPLNYERLYRKLNETGLHAQIKAFERASAFFQNIQYKAEHEAMLRTSDYAGYQLLMLNDFTGQSEALVGVLDPFWESKGVVGAAQIRQWNSPLVPLARFDTFVWDTQETFTAGLEVAYYGPKDLSDVTGHWSVHLASGEKLASGMLGPLDLPTGHVTALGQVSVWLGEISQATRLQLAVTIGSSQNQWSLWAYPRVTVPSESSGVIVTSDVKEMFNALDNGEKVLFVGHALKSNLAKRTGFASVYWSAGWWGSPFSNLGILCDPTHPALVRFPNDGHSDWQWHDLLSEGNTFLLNDLADQCQPIVRMVPDFHYNSHLAQVLETRVGQGRLLLCGYDLSSNLSERPAARQLRHSLVTYMQSGQFVPQREMSKHGLKKLLGQRLIADYGGHVISADSQSKGHEAALAVDGDPSTLWHTPWQRESPGYPHEIVIALDEKQNLTGVKLLPRQDGNRNGRVKTIAIYVSRDSQKWSRIVKQADMANDTQWQMIPFGKSVPVRFIRIVAMSPQNPEHPWASFAEIDVTADP